MATLFHGTTFQRATQIEVNGPDPRFREAPGDPSVLESFSTCLALGPFPLGTPEMYACGKSKQFLSEKGPAVLVMDVPDDVIALTDQAYFPLSQGVVQFDEGGGLEELRARWPKLRKRVIPIRCL
jgi:hypothetical protein